MKKLLTLALAFVTYVGFGQIETPAASPSSKVEQTVGLTTITIEYSRPGVKGRTIFAEDGLVPLGKKWRTGANAATKISFSDDVTVGGTKLEAGPYAVLTTPNAESWDVHFYKHESRGFGPYLEKEPDASYTADVRKMNGSMETFTISVQDITTNSCNIDILWADTWVAVPVEVEVDERVMANIERVMAGPSNNDYYQAASYMHTAGKDLNTALAYINKATDVEEPRFWQVRRKALILADMGRVKEAIAAATQSLELAEKAGNDDYIRMNKKSIDEWSSK